MKRVLAVSGGVDSMAMLEILAGEGRRQRGGAERLVDDYASGDIKTANFEEKTPKNADFSENYSSGDILVAHFDHGTRASSAEDAEFVGRAAKEYGVEYRVGRAALGEGAAEEAARAARYGFLRRVAAETSGEIYTAHHLDDLVESITINLLRGTGWRGLAALDGPGVRRPFLEPELLPPASGLVAPVAKREILEYAARRGLRFRQDSTNCEDYYLRNRVRARLGASIDRRRLYGLWREQKRLKAEIDRLVAELLPPEGAAWRRSWFRGLDEAVALELLRAGVKRAGVSATRPQLAEFRRAILNYAPGKYFNLPRDRLVRIEKDVFYL